MGLREEYRARFPVLEGVKEDLRSEVGVILSKIPRVDGVLARAKSLERFMEKARRTDDRGRARYAHPLEDIQDQIGVRVVVYYKSDVDLVATAILKEIREIEDMEVEPSEPESFGYQSRHLMCLIPPDIVSRHKPPIEFFELQIGTLFQHAWAEANHNLGYKPEFELTFQEKRRIAFAAAQAWGADEVFEDLWRERRASGRGP